MYRSSHIFLLLLSYLRCYILKYRSISLYLHSRIMSRKVLMSFLPISCTISSLRNVTCFARNKKSHSHYAVNIFLKMPRTLPAKSIKSLLRNLGNTEMRKQTLFPTSLFRIIILLYEYFIFLNRPYNFDISHS